MEATDEDLIVEAVKVTFPEIKALRKEQQNAIEHVVKQENDLIALLPTGYGKSLIYQILPTLHDMRKDVRRIVAVVTPLNAIMDQQVEELSSRKMLSRNIKAASLNSGESHEEIKNGNVDNVFGSAERWLSEEWKKELLEGKLGQLLAELCVDEAHTVIGWGTKSGGKRKGRTDEPFRQAFGRISELRSLIPKCPLIALSASIRISHRQLLQKVLSMEGAKVVNMSPNKTNVRLSAVKVADAADALSKLDWLVKLVQEKKAQTPKCIIFCNVLTDIAQVLSYLLMKLGDSAYITCNDKKQWLLAVYHSQTWEETKSSINNDFKIIDLSSVRIVIATTSLSMGVNFQDVRYIIHFLAPARTLEDHVQQLGRAGRDGNQSHDISFVCNQNLKDCENDIKKIFKSQNVCLRVSLLKSFDENVISLDPKHNCCSVCASSCNCNIETGLCDSLKPAFEEDKKTYDPPHLGKKRSITDSDKQDFKAALLDEQDRFTFAEGGVSIFGTETLHGFSDQLVEKCIENLDILLNSRNILELLPLYSVKHARIILELLQEFFNDIPDFETEINILCEAEIRLDIELEYLTLMELFSENGEDESETYEEDIDSIDFESDFLGDDDILPEFELRL